MLNVVADTEVCTDDRLSLDAICRDGARGMLAAALEEEAAAYIESFVDHVGDDGHARIAHGPCVTPWRACGGDQRGCGPYVMPWRACGGDQRGCGPYVMPWRACGGDQLCVDEFAAEFVVALGPAERPQREDERQ